MPEPLMHLEAALADRYRLERELGHGGMATVYLAHDVRHDRKVALKVLREELASTVGVERFLREVRIAGQLQHPHIVPMFESGAGPGGLLWYAMPWIQGETLRARLQRDGPLDPAEAMRLILEIAEAVGAAHAAGIVHRDLKPENVMLSGRHALVADFGIARALTGPSDGQSLTTAGWMVGTPGYMAPEQMAGSSDVDQRADIYALGVIGYELVTGRPPFAGSTPQRILASQLTEAPVPIEQLRDGVPAGLAGALIRCLAKEPADRFATVEEFAAALGRTPTAPGRRDVVRRLGGPRRRPLVAGVAVGLALAAVILWAWRPTAPAADTIAVLPFENVGGDPANEPFSTGMSDELASQLAAVGGLQVASRTSAAALKRRGLDAQEIGRRLGVGLILDGGVRRAGERLRLSWELIRAETGLRLEGGELERPAGDAFAVQDEITGAIMRTLNRRLRQEDSRQFARRRTGNATAHDLYQQGRFNFERRTDSVSLRRAREFFERAVEEDSTYALAYAGLSDGYSHAAIFGYLKPEEAYRPAKAAALAALTLNPNLVEAEAAMGFLALFYDWDWPEAARRLARADSLDPRYPLTRLYRGWYFVATDSLDRAVAEVREAVRLDPFSGIAHARLADMLYFAGRYDEAIAQANRVAALEPAVSVLRAMLGRTLMATGRCDEALQTTVGVADALAGQYRGRQGYIFARCGRPDRANAALEGLAVDARAGRYAPQYSRAMILAGLGDTARMFAALDSAAMTRDWTMFTLRADPVFQPYHGTARFEEILGRVGLASRRPAVP